MSSFRVELNSAGVRELLKSPEIQAELQKHGNKIAGKVKGTGALPGVGKTRAHVNVVGNMRQDKELLHAMGSTGND